MSTLILIRLLFCVRSLRRLFDVELPFRYKDQDLGELFKDYGKLEECRVFGMNCW